MYCHHVIRNKHNVDSDVLQGGAKVTIPKKKIEYFSYGLIKGADFFVSDRGMAGVYIHIVTAGKYLC